jgi:GH43 family beta-xylosidase
VAVMVVTHALGGRVRMRDGTFVNPLLPSGPDPWVLEHDGAYFYMNTTWTTLSIARVRNPADLHAAESVVVWVPPRSGPFSQELWAPEIHFLDGSWFIYVAADDGNNDNHRLWVLQNESPDPLSGNWSMRGRVFDPANDTWAIDGTVFEHEGSLYMLWSGWLGAVNGQQNIFIARMANPWTLSSGRVLLSSPTEPWERLGSLLPDNVTHVYVNEGPQAVRNAEGNLFVSYSANGCWTDYYSLGALRFLGGDILDPHSWKKLPGPLFETSVAAGVYAPGHNAFFKSPDGTEDWLLYHANPGPNAGCGWLRSPRAQQFAWDASGAPVFGTPVPAGMPIARPS